MANALTNVLSATKAAAGDLFKFIGFVAAIMHLKETYDSPAPFYQKLPAYIAHTIYATASLLAGITVLVMAAGIATIAISPVLMTLSAAQFIDTISLIYRDLVEFFHFKSEVKKNAASLGMPDNILNSRRKFFQYIKITPEMKDWIKHDFSNKPENQALIKQLESIFPEYLAKNSIALESEIFLIQEALNKNYEPYLDFTDAIHKRNILFLKIPMQIANAVMAATVFALSISVLAAPATLGGSLALTIASIAVAAVATLISGIMFVKTTQKKEQNKEKSKDIFFDALSLKCENAQLYRQTPIFKQGSEYRSEDQNFKATIQIKRNAKEPSSVEDISPKQKLESESEPKISLFFQKWTKTTPTPTPKQPSLKNTSDITEIKKPKT